MEILQWIEVLGFRVQGWTSWRSLQRIEVLGFRVGLRGDLYNGLRWKFNNTHTHK